MSTTFSCIPNILPSSPSRHLLSLILTVTSYILPVSSSFNVSPLIILVPFSSSSSAFLCKISGITFRRCTLRSGQLVPIRSLSAGILHISINLSSKTFMSGINTAVCTRTDSWLRGTFISYKDRITTQIQRVPAIAPPTYSSYLYIKEVKYVCIYICSQR